MKRKLSEHMEQETVTLPEKAGVGDVKPRLPVQEFHWLVWGGIVSGPDTIWQPHDLSCIVHGTMEAHGPFPDKHEAVAFRVQRLTVHSMLRLTLHRVTRDDAAMEAVMLLIRVFESMNLRVYASMTENLTGLNVRILSGVSDAIPARFMWAGIEVRMDSVGSVTL